MDDQQSSNKLTSEQREQRLSQAVTQEVARGARVESQSSSMAVVVRGKKPNHILHLILTLVTFGFWVFVWVILAIACRERRETITVDEFGHVLRQ